MELDLAVNEKNLVIRGARWTRLRKRGLSLVEGAAVLAIAAVVIASALLLYGMANTNRQISQANQDLTVLQQAVRSLYVGQSSYDGVSNDALIATKALPARMVAGNDLRHALNGLINITPANAGAGTNSGFQIEFTNVPQEACARLLTNDLGRSLYSAGAATTRTQAEGLPFNPSQAAQSCTGTYNTIRWVFN